MIYRFEASIFNYMELLTLLQVIGFVMGHPYKDIVFAFVSLSPCFDSQWYRGPVVSLTILIEILIFVSDRQKKIYRIHYWSS